MEVAKLPPLTDKEVQALIQSLPPEKASQVRAELAQATKQKRTSPVR